MPRSLSIDSDLFDMPPRPTSPISFSRHPPSSCAADISRLLDPSYSSNAYASTSAYVDRNGDLHDPDYRHFPIAQPTTSKRHAYTMATRPRWELVDEDAVDDEDEEEEDYSRSSIIGRRHPRDAHSNSFSSYQQQRPFATYTYHPTPTYSHNNKPHHHYHHYHVPQSFDSDETVLDEYDEDDDAFATGDKDSKCNGVSRMILRTKREFTKKRRSLDGASRKSIDSSSPYSPTLIDTPATTTTAVSTEPEPEDAASLHAPSHHHPLTYTLSHQSYSRRSQHSRVSFHSEPHHLLTPNHTLSSDSHPHNTSSSSHDPAYTPYTDDQREPVWTPTCMQALRRQWQAVSLRIRFSMFRAQRRMKSRLAML